jgi:hypothetical protein
MISSQGTPVLINDTHFQTNISTLSGTTLTYSNSTGQFLFTPLVASTSFNVTYYGIMVNTSYIASNATS